MLDGPYPGTIDSHNLTRQVLSLWEGHLGERFVTQDWNGYSISKTVSKCQNKIWKSANYSNFDIA